MVVAAVVVVGGSVVVVVVVVVGGSVVVVVVVVVVVLDVVVVGAVVVVAAVVVVVGVTPKGVSALCWGSVLVDGHSASRLLAEESSRGDVQTCPPVPSKWYSAAVEPSDVNGLVAGVKGFVV